MIIKHSDNSISYAELYSDEYLAHHGVKGMRWGVRKQYNSHYEAVRDSKLYATNQKLSNIAKDRQGMNITKQEYNIKRKALLNDYHADLKKTRENLKKQYQNPDKHNKLREAYKKAIQKNMKDIPAYGDIMDRRKADKIMGAALSPLIVGTLGANLASTITMAHIAPAIGVPMAVASAGMSSYLGYTTFNKKYRNEHALDYHVNKYTGTRDRKYL